MQKALIGIWRGNPNMDLVSIGENSHLPQVHQESMRRVISVLQSISDNQQTPEPEMLTLEYREKLADQISFCLQSGDFAEAKDKLMRLNLIDMHITQTYADMDAGARQKLESAIEQARVTGQPISLRFLECAADRYARIIERMDEDGQSANPALVEYLNLYSTVLELLGEKDHAQAVHDRIPTVMVAMLEQQKAQAAKFCLAEKAYWDEQIVLLQAAPCLSYEELQTAKKALRFYEHKEAMLCAITRDEAAIEDCLKELRTLVLGVRAA